MTKDEALLYSSTQVQYSLYGAVACSVPVGGECMAWNDNTHLDASTLLSALFPVCSGMAEQLWSPQNITSQGATAETYERLIQRRCALLARGIPAAASATGPGIGWAGDVGYCPVELSTRASCT
jgi:hypothetical protein